jgi:YD repeat-containing protein
MKKLLAFIASVALLAGVAGCSGEIPEETAPAATEPSSTVREAASISRLQWLVNDAYDPGELWSCEYDPDSNTLVITGEGCGTREILFFEGGKQVRKETCMDGDQILTQKEYDEQGSLICELDADGYRRVYTYDRGLLTTETVYLTDPEPLTVKTWSYDGNGRKVACSEVADDGQVIQQETWVYDGNGNLIDYRLNNVYNDNTWYQHEAFTYEEGVLVKSYHEGDDPANAWEYTIDYRYDDRGRKISALRHEEFYGDAEDIWEYDTQGRVTKSVEHYNMDGWLAETREFEYNSAGQLIREYFCENSEGDDEPSFWSETLYTYDAAGLLTERTDANNSDEVTTVSCAYDAMGNRTLYSRRYNGEEEYLLICDYDSQGNLVRVDRNGEEVLKGESILFLTNENRLEFYMAAEYEKAPAADAAEVTAVNEFILNYIQNSFYYE